MEAEASGSRQRIAIAIAAACALGAIVAIAGGGDEEQVERPLPDECVRAWNDDQSALAYGRHNFNFHLYRGALVIYLDRDGVETSEQEGSCAAIFPAEVLDAEPIAAGQILNGRRWDPVSALPGIDLTRVAELQVTAAGAPNAELDTSGQLGSL